MRNFFGLLIRRAAAVVGVAATLLAIAQQSRAETVDLELVLAVDASASVGGWEYYTQIHGYADAFRNPAVLSAIQSIGDRGIAVTLVLWSSANAQSMVVDWHIIRNAGDTQKFAGALVTANRTSAGKTAIGNALLFAANLLTNDDIKGRRRTIDLSGDGSDDDGLGAPRARDLIVANNITINALAIVSGDLKLESYYRDNVIGGPNAFVEVAKSYASFPPAVLRKLLREIQGLPVSQDNRKYKKQLAFGPP